MSNSIDLPADFDSRHLGPRTTDVRTMLESIGVESLSALISEAVPADIRLGRELELPAATPEDRLLDRLRDIASENLPFRSYLGLGYHDSITPGVIQRNILENPGWYTQYTPYQAEISQGRLEALLNFQTMVSDMTGLPIANASLLDEGTAAAEAMALTAGAFKGEPHRFLAASDCHPQTLAVVQTRAAALGIEVAIFDPDEFEFDDQTFGILLQYPSTDGRVRDYAELTARAHEAGAGVVVAADLMSLALLVPPGEFGADVAVGNTQRFGVPMGYGGPHAAYIAASEAYKRRMPGRIIGVSVDVDGNRALRMALQTREQHIRREKATSNICTAQVLLAIMAGAYAVYHGPTGVRAIAGRIHDLTRSLAAGVKAQGHQLVHEAFFDTLRVRPVGRSAKDILAAATARSINLRDYGDGTVGVAFDERVRPEDVDDVLASFRGDGGGDAGAGPTARGLAAELSEGSAIPKHLQRQSAYLQHEVFQAYRSETEMLRYLHRLESKDLSLTSSMIPLGSCTMKLNATTQMAAVTWPEFGQIHPFAPLSQTGGYQRITSDLEAWLGEISGFAAVSLQPNSGAQGEYAGLLVIRAAHEDRGEAGRRVCLIPSSAHGTNPASAVMAGMQVRVVACDTDGNIDIQDLRAKAAEAGDQLSAIMVTYPSTHGVFESSIREICNIVHGHGGLVYLDGANLNAQVGLARPGDYGADVCHINLHKTFSIPHGGGGPGMGPICVTEALAPYLPGHPLVDVGGDKAIGPVSAAPWGSASILVISWAYIALLGARGVRAASEVAILNANYMVSRLEEQFDVLFRGPGGRVAHEFILDLRPFRKTSGVTEEDVAKRLIDYGFHAPTMSWPVPGTIMVEPTESESIFELNRFCDAMISIRTEIEQVELGIADREDNALKNAPHPASMVVSDSWDHAYSRELAAFPVPWVRAHKFWPAVRRVDNAHGDRNLVCTCPPVEEYS